MIESATESGEITAVAYLVLASSGSWCDIHALAPGSPTVIGRDGDNQIVLHSSRCSRRHCEVFLRNETWFVRDLGSSNGTLLNGESLNEIQPLTPGDRLEVAGTVFLLTSSIYEIDGEDASMDASHFDSDAPTAVSKDASSSDDGSSTSLQTND